MAIIEIQPYEYYDYIVQRKEFEAIVLPDYVLECKITVDSKLDHPHPFVVKTLKRINRRDIKNGCVCSGFRTLQIRVSPNNIERALCIMDALIKVFISLRVKVFIKDEDYTWGPYISLEDEEFGFDIYEKTHFAGLVKGNYGEERVFKPTGILVLRINNGWGTVKQWEDKPKQKIEECLHKFIENIYRRAFQCKANRIKEEEKRREYAAYQRQLEVLKLQQEIEQKRVKALENEALNWNKSRIIRTYIKNAVKAYILKNGHVEPSSDFDLWRTWALKQADCFDPLTNIAELLIPET